MRCDSGFCIYLLAHLPHGARRSKDSLAQTTGAQTTAPSPKGNIMNKKGLVIIKMLLLLAAAASFSGCATAPSSRQTVGAPEQAAEQPPPETERPPCETGRINHVVLVWLKEPGNADHRQRIIDASHAFRQIPGVVEVRAGEVVPSGRGIVDDSFDVGLSIAFANTGNMDRYIHHPHHKKAVREVIRPLAERIVVYDFMECRGTPPFE